MIEVLDRFEASYGCDKKYINHGYYRVRTISENKKEIAHLMMDACGSTIVNPQITIEKKDQQWIPTQLIDLYQTPTKSISRTLDTESDLDHQFTQLLEQFKAVMSETE